MMVILIAIVFFIFGFMVSAIFASEKIKTLEAKVEHQHRLRMMLVDKEIEVASNILNVLNRDKK